MTNKTRQIIFYLCFCTFGVTPPLMAQKQESLPSNIQMNLETELEKEMEEQFTFISKEIETQKDWYRSIQSQTFEEAALILPSDRDPLDVLLRRTKALTNHLKSTTTLDSEILNRLGLITTKAISSKVSNVQERKRMFADLFSLRREISFSNSLLNFTDLLFTASHSSAGDSHMCDQYYGVFARPGGSILQLSDAFGTNPKVTDVMANIQVLDGRLKGRTLKGGMFLLPELSYDGKELLFSYSECERDSNEPTPRKSGTYDWTQNSSFHIFKMDLETNELHQLTDGGWNDVHPCWMPNNDIAFISERRGGFLRCSGARPCPNYTLHSMDNDGERLARISHHETNEWHPSINNNGMLVYTRWDYVDRGDDQAHHPWVTTPDGRNPKAIHGNYKLRHHDNPDMEVYVRPIPNSKKYISLAAPHHGGSYGTLVLVDPEAVDDDAMNPVKRLTPEDGFPESRYTNPSDDKVYENNRTFRHSFSGQAERANRMYGAASPLSEHFFLTTRNKKLYLVDAFGNWELLYSLPNFYCLGPVPLRPRPTPPIIPAQSEPLLLDTSTHYTKIGDIHPIASPHEAKAGTMVLLDVYNSLYPFPEGTKIEQLRIVQVLQKTTPIHQAPAIGYGAETPARAILGTVPIEDDGSAYFYLPPGKSVYFQALDGNGEAVQSMRSATYMQGGEKVSCIGCHEPKDRAPNPSKGMALALKRAPSTITPELEGTNPFSYPRLVQPVLDKHCIKCHNGQDKRPFDLREGDWKNDTYHWYTSYRNLHPYTWHHGSFQPGYDLWLTSRSKPGEVGAKASKLLSHLKNGHKDVKLSKEELHRIVLWLDGNSDFFGSYEQTAEQAQKQIIEPRME